MVQRFSSFPNSLNSLIQVDISIHENTFKKYIFIDKIQITCKECKKVNWYMTAYQSIRFGASGI